MALKLERQSKPAMPCQWPSEIPYCPHYPHPKQKQFLDLDCREALYGGAAGGGKTDALLMAALQYVHVPGYNALILRRTYTSLALPTSIMSRFKEWIRGTDVRWSETLKRATFPSGATITFAYLEHKRDLDRYQGPEFQFIGWEELTQFEEYAYRYMFSRTRRLAGSPVPIRVRSTANPGGVGHEWVRQRFFVANDGSRVFIPAKLADNPSLDRDEYTESLNELDPVTRAQLLDGNWDARPPGLWFDRLNFVMVGERPATGRWVRFWDFAATEESEGTDPDYTVGVLMGRRDLEYYIADVRRVRKSPSGVEALVRQTAQLDGDGVAIRWEEEPGSSGKFVTADFVRRVLPGYDARGRRVTGDIQVRARPLAAQVAIGNVKLVEGAWNLAFFDEYEAFPNEGLHDDQVSAGAGALQELTKKRDWVAV